MSLFSSSAGSASTDITLNAYAGRKPDGADAGTPIMVMLEPPEGTHRTPSDICCVVDTSGSMNSDAILKDDSGEISHGLSILDIVKHALRTLIGNLGDLDRMAVVSYSNAATTVSPLTPMTGNGKVTTEESLSQLTPNGMTNLWDGFKTGFELLKAGSDGKRFQHLLLFTDGIPNINPPRGIVPMLKKLKDTEGGRLPCVVSTFGFGYELDSEMLSQFARIGFGSYNFIPDAGLVGTVFVNALSNLLVCAAKNVQLVLKPLNGMQFAGHALGGLPTTEQDGALTVDLGQVQFGQSRQVLVPMSFTGDLPPGADYLQVTLKYSTHGAPTSCEKKFQKTDDVEVVESQRLRVQFVDVCRKAMEKMSFTGGPEQVAAALLEGQGMIKAFMDEVETSPACDADSVKALLEDVTGQVSEAFSREDWYSKWGRHYLPSLMFAHLMQQCNNFKDSGVQCYGGELFDKLRDEADQFFVKLPPPEPSIQRPSSAASRTGYTPAAPVNMSAYMDRYAGCVDGECMVQMADGSSQRVAELRKGDSVATPDGTHAEVVCAVRTIAPDGKFLMSELPGGLRVTPYHPVWMDGAWRFPLDLAPAAEVDCRAVYTFVLEEVKASAVGFIVNGVPCAPLGHGVEEGAAKHPYLGSRRVVEDLRECPGFRAGLVDLAPGSVARDPETGLVCALTAS
mmetsp:Transcript_115465/g.327175  ORF Transcript_115465/g.327175 Transcript_115465/m.327175 type:complete len:679 (-) Transcript_115465:42-2078(-)